MTSGVPIHLPSPRAENAPPSTLYHILLEAVPHIANAATQGDALEGLFQILQQHGAALALGMEIVSGSTKQFMPYGEVAALTTTGTNGRRQFLCALHGAHVPNGWIRYVFAPDTCVTQELLDAVTTQMCLRLSRDGMAKQIEAAEDRAQHLNRRANELFKISTLSRTLISINLDELLARVADDICDTVGFERCCLYLREPIGMTFLARVWRGYNEAIGRNPIRDRDSAIGATARSKTLRSFDARDPRPEGESAEREYLQMLGFARSLGTDSFVAVPILTSKNDCVGVVVVDNKGKGRTTGEEQTRLLTAFVSQAGLAIENARLHEKTQRLTDYTDNVLQSIGDGILSTDSRGHIARWNRAAAAILEQPTGFFRNTTLIEVVRQMAVTPVERDHLLELMTRLPETGERMLMQELTLRPKRGTPRNLILKLFRLGEHGRERTGIVMMLEDVTQHVRMQGEMERMRRLADIGQLAAKMAHEVRNALSPIKGAAQIIRLELETQGVSTEWPDIIVTEVDGLSRLTSAMLDFARPMPFDPRPLNIPEFLTAAVQKLSAFLTEHRVAVTREMTPDLPDIEADPIQLGQVVRNVVMNAAQSMPDGGELILGATYDISTDMVTLTFRDTGVGIEEGERERIFRPFVTTKPKGSGLGLPIVQKIVAGHGGRVEVESRSGVGTCFRVLLPVRPPREFSEHMGGDNPLISSSLTGPFPDS